MCGARGWACVTRVHVDSRGQSQVFLRCPLLFAQLFQYWGLSLEHRASKANTYQWAPAPAPPTYFLEPSSVAWNLPSGISWLVPEPQGSACLYLPCTGITSMPPCPAFFSCALDIKLGSWCSQGKCFNDISLLTPDFCLSVFFRDKFSKNSRQIQDYCVDLELTYVAQAGLELRVTVPWYSSVKTTVVNHYAQLKTVTFLKNRSDCSQAEIHLWFLRYNTTTTSRRRRKNTGFQQKLKLSCFKGRKWKDSSVSILP